MAHFIFRCIGNIGKYLQQNIKDFSNVYDARQHKRM